MSTASSHSETIIFLFGLLAALSTLQNLNEVKGKAWFLQVLFVLGIGTQIATQFIQYSNAIGNRKREERLFAFSLWAYTQKDMEYLKRLVAKDNPYMIGHRYIRDYNINKLNSDTQIYLNQAKVYLQDALDRGSFVAPSYYLLAYIEKISSKDWTEARNHIDIAIEYDEEYAAAYYFRALLEMKANSLTLALNDLKQAVKYDSGQCGDLLNAEEILTVWLPIPDDSKFRELQNTCRVKYGLPTK